jgi:Ser/Thr protein kinase RdoA (MazF antagonist)
VHEIPVSFSRGAGIFLLWQSIQVTESTNFENLSTEDQIGSLTSCVQGILSQFDLDVAGFESINHGFNSTFKITTVSGERFALRVNVNSTKTLENLRAEVQWVQGIRDVLVPTPIANSSGEFITFAHHDASGRTLPAVLFSWLEGEEVGDEPTADQLFAAGAAMAKLHISSKGFKFRADASLPLIDSVLWGAADYLCGEGAALSQEDQQDMKIAYELIQEVINRQLAENEPQPIHADMHGWNLMWHDGKLAVFDFDDAMMGTPLIDLATAIYYLDTEEQDQMFLDGYRSITPLMSYSPRDLDILRMQRRIVLLNYLFETSNPEHQAIIPEYQSETMRRVKALLP